MPELPEVERAVVLLRNIAQNNRIVDVETTDDPIVYSGGITHTDFAAALKGRVVKDVGRYGKVFYFDLKGKGKMPVLHFGMTGMLQVKGQLPLCYKETPKWAAADQWPPRFMKFILHIADRESGEITLVAFLDPRRLGRIRLCASPLQEPPISALGFDPILSMPTLEAFKGLALKRTCPIKALLLDQSFSAGVGNWVADEILYHSRVHPERRCNTLSDNELMTLHTQTSEVCKIAVSLDADDSKFPENWLFKHRWGKGKKKEHSLLLPSGEPATIKWITVGGRTSAFVAEIQHGSVQKTVEVDDSDDNSDPTPHEEDKQPSRRKRERKDSAEPSVVSKRVTRSRTVVSSSVATKRKRHA